MGHLIPWRGLGVHPDHALGDVDGIAADVIRKGIEGAAAGKVEPGVMPMAGKDAVLDASPVQRKAHVGTTVVHREQLAIVVEHRYGVTAAGDHGTTTRF